MRISGRAMRLSHSYAERVETKPATGRLDDWVTLVFGPKTVAASDVDQIALPEVAVFISPLQPFTSRSDSRVRKWAISASSKWPGYGFGNYSIHQMRCERLYGARKILPV